MSTALDLNVGRSAPPRLPINELLVGLAVCGSACLSIFLTHIPGGIALFWPASAIGAALLGRPAKVRWRFAFAFIAVAMLLPNALLAHRPWSIAALFAGVNLLETAAMIAAFRTLWRRPHAHMTINKGALLALIVGVAIPGAAALAGGLLLHTYYGAAFLRGMLQWWSAHTVGACLVGPPLILCSKKGMDRLLQKRFVARNALMLMVCVVGSGLVIRYVSFPFVTIGFLLTVAAFQMGGFGASLMSFAVGLTITNLWAWGIRPMGLDQHVAAGSLIGLPVIALLTTVMPAIAVGLGSDARRAARRALAASERRFRQSMENSPIGMLIANLDGVWGFTNFALQKMLGFTADEFLAMPAGGPSKQDDWKESKSRWQRLVSGELDFYDVPRCFRHKDGRWVWTHVAVSLTRDADGNPLNLVAQIESLESRRQAEETLAAERERLKITLESISDAVITTDAGTRITYINAAAELLLGLDVESVKNRRVDEVIHLMDPDTAKPSANLINQSAHQTKVLRREKPCLLHRPDGTISYVIDVVSPVLDATGALSGLVIVFRDATGDIDRSRDLQHRALHDPLTGLSNRDDFNTRLRHAFAKAHHFERPAAVIAIDLDRFKTVNDSAGHAAGDAVLCKVAESLRQTVRSSDTVARLGGDEFAIILENCVEERAQRIGQQLLQALNPLTADLGNTQHCVGASLGLAMNVPQLADEHAWLEAADRALYVAKREGRGRMRVAPSTQEPGVFSRLG